MVSSNGWGSVQEIGRIDMTTRERRPRRITLAAAAALTIAAFTTSAIGPPVARVAAQRPSPTPPPPAPIAFAPADAAPGGGLSAAPAAESPCEFIMDAAAAPGQVRVGEPVSVTLRLRPMCIRVPDQVHVVVVADAAGPGSEGAMKQLLDAFAQNAYVPSQTTLDYRIGMVQYNRQADRLCGLTKSAELLRACANRYVLSGGPARIDLGLAEGLAVLRAGRREVPQGVAAAEVIILTADNASDNGCAPVVEAAREAREEGILTVAVASLGSGAGETATCLRDTATSPFYFVALPETQYFAAHGVLLSFERMFLNHAIYRVRRVTATVALSRDMPLVPASLDGLVRGTNDAFVRWQRDTPAGDEVVLRFQVVPRAAGELPVFQEAWLDATVHSRTDPGRARTESWRVPAPRVRVTAP